MNQFPEKMVEHRPADKPHSVAWKGMRVARFPDRWSSLLAGCHHPARAAHPGPIRKRAVFCRRSGHGPCLALLRLGVAWPLHYGSAGGLLHHHFTLALAGGMFLWPYPAGSSEESPPRVLPGNLPCGVRTFLDADRSTPRPSGRPVHPSYSLAAASSINRSHALQSQISIERVAKRESSSQY